MLIELTFLAVAGLVIATIVWSSLRTGSPPVPTSPVVLRAMIGLLPARLPGDDRNAIVEMGSGWGGVAFALARRYPDHPVIGYEVSLLPYVVSRLRLLLRPCPNLRFIRKNFMNSDLSGAALAVCYLMRNEMTELSEKLVSEMAEGALVLSNTFALPGWQALDQITAKDMYSSPVYLYEVRKS
jgi:hypothetical protein